LEDEIDIDYVVAWQDKNTNDTYKQVLCRIYEKMSEKWI
jgi:hypothetical protein